MERYGDTWVDVGDVWRDEDGLFWRIVATEPAWVWVRPYRSPKSKAVQTSPKWLEHWTLFRRAGALVRST